MKHIVLSETFKFTTEPFTAFRANIVYGRNKHDREFLPVKTVVPTVEYVVTRDYNEDPRRSVLYRGSDKAAADTAKTKYDEEQKPKALGCVPSTADLVVGPSLLPEDGFQIIKTREKGTILVVPGMDRTNRALLFVGCIGGFRGGVTLLSGETSAQILKECSAGNALESRVDVIAIIGIGQRVAFHTYGRRTNEVYVYEWTGTEVKRTHFLKEEWDERNQVAAPHIEDAETL